MKKIVVLGGGTGISYLLRGLKDFPVDITAVISVSDNGKSTGKLRNEFYIPAVGDIRKVIYNMSPLPEEFKNVMEYRFNTYSDLNGHPMGNLLLTAMLTSSGSLLKSIDCMRYLLDVKHKILPLSEDFLTLMGETVDGEIVEGEDDLPKSGKKYKRIFYKECPHVLPEVLSAISEADLVILSMGSLYTSIIPHLICSDIQNSLRDSKAKVMYLCNAMTQPGETSGFTVSDHLKVIESYLGADVLDTVVVSDSEISKEMLDKYSNQEQKDPVIIDDSEIEKMGIEIIKENLLTIDDGTLKHNSLKLSSIIFSYLMR
ncbi:MAG: uridine diphosphate-N-acetylglucosamine-binding protein YvcK [Bacilli bacterium]|nr:uridine diphosphate-N-acetylglucosamine-binding protein YvcK [Bacilli bacterium]